jgi:uncharacterized membrane protein YeaQ/YmgE (transglycosylase-associated protein family)
MGLGIIIVILLVGALAGWLAGQIVSGYGFGLMGNVVLGLVGVATVQVILPGLPAGCFDLR